MAKKRPADIRNPEPKEHPNVSAYMPNEQVVINDTDAIMYFTVYAQVIRDGVPTFVEFQSGARLTADMAIIRNTIRILLKTMYAPAERITIMSQEQYDAALAAARKADPDVKISKVVNSSKVMDA